MVKAKKLTKTQLKFVKKYAKPLSGKRIEAMLRLRKKKHTMKEISEKAEVSLSTVKKYLKGTSIKEKPVIQKRLDMKKARLIAHCLFDGCIMPKEYRITYGNKSEGLIKKFTKDFLDVYGLSKPYLYQDKWGCISASFYSKKIIEDFLRYTPSYTTSDPNAPTMIPRDILNGSKKNKIVFLRAFWDDEGSVLLNKGSRSLVAVCYNDQMLLDLYEMHKSLGIECIVRLHRHEIAIYKEMYIRKFREVVGFSDEALVVKGRWSDFRKNDVLVALLETFIKP